MGFIFLDRINRIDPDEIKAATISSRLNWRAIPKCSHLTGQVGQDGYFFRLSGRKPESIIAFGEEKISFVFKAKMFEMMLFAYHEPTYGHLTSPLPSGGLSFSSFFRKLIKINKEILKIPMIL